MFVIETFQNWYQINVVRVYFWHVYIVQTLNTHTGRGATTLSLKFWKGRDLKKMSAWEGLNKSLPLIFACRGIIMFLVKKDFIKNNFQLSIFTCFSQTTN